MALRCSPHELMCEYVAGINRACQAQRGKTQ